MLNLFQIKKIIIIYKEYLTTQYYSTDKTVYKTVVDNLQIIKLVKLGVR